MYLHFIQFSVITYVMGVQKSKKSISKKNKRLSSRIYSKNISLFVNKENKKIHLRHHIVFN
ncbi:50S ribosomal protein L32 [Candidatus Nasuia deltocephalinicola]|uniref:50S ribosomal protein L32 n=1 Tax=Candidatus Nasuia deltocephalincola TaxID=1160784 RepID=UPI00216ABF79|nr:50S ribosomal protein L32 [Candidatus Nasuia deltocephalinicola]